MFQNGITLVVDHLSAVMLVITAIIGLAANIYALDDIDRRYQALNFHTLYQILIAAISGAFLTGDLFNLYVWFEVLLIASFVLLALGGERAQLEGALKYVALNLVASAVLLVTLADRPAFRATVPSKVQTYMAIGRPILASLNGEGARLVQEAGAGLATPAEDAAALAQALLQLYRMAPEERARLGANGRRYFETHFERSRLVDRLLGHFRLFVDSHRSEQ